jgi:hypothetical protein
MLRTCPVQTVPYELLGGKPGTPFRAVLESDRAFVEKRQPLYRGR